MIFSFSLLPDLTILSYCGSGERRPMVKNRKIFSIFDHPRPVGSGPDHTDLWAEARAFRAWARMDPGSTSTSGSTHPKNAKYVDIYKRLC